MEYPSNSAGNDFNHISNRLTLTPHNTFIREYDEIIIIIANAIMVEIHLICGKIKRKMSRIMNTEKAIAITPSHTEPIYETIHTL